MADTVKFIVKAEDQATPVLKQVDSTLAKNAANFKKTGAAVSAFGAALSTVAIKSAAEFEDKMSDVNTLLGSNQEEMKALGDEVLNLSTRVPIDGSVLSESLYSVISAGISDTTQAMGVLEESARLGVAGLGTTAEATDLLTSSINAFGLDAADAKSVSDVLFKTVKAGKTDISQLATSFGLVAPIAAAAGVTFEELQASTAALTTSGLQTSVAQGQLKALFTEMTREGNKLSKAFEGIGVANVQAQIESQGFVETLTQLKREGNLTDTEFKNLFASVEAGGAALSLTGNQAEAFNIAMTDMTEGALAVDKAFDIQMEDFNAQLKLLTNELKTIAIQTGQILMPILKSFIGFMQGMSPELRKSIAIFGAITAAIALIAGPILIMIGFIPAIVAGFAAIGTAITAVVSGIGILITALATLTLPITLTIAAIAALIAIGVALYQNWDTIAAKGISIWNKLKAFLKETMASMSAAFSKFWESMKLKIQESILFIVEFFTKSKETVTSAFSTMFSGIAGVAKSIFNNVINIISGFVNKVISLINRAIEMANKLPGVNFAIIPTIPSANFAHGGIVGKGANNGQPIDVQKFATGGIVQGAGGLDNVPAMLSPGEVVLNAAQQQNLAGKINNGGGTNISITINAGNVVGDLNEFADDIGEKIIKTFQQHTAFQSF